MKQQATTIFNSLRSKGHNGEKLIDRFLRSGIILLEKAQKDGSKEIADVAFDIFQNASVLAKSKGFRPLTLKANELAEQAKDLNKNLKRENL